MVKPPPDAMTLPEAGKLAELSPTTLRVLIFQGKLKATKIGRDWVVGRAELKAYLKARRPRSPQGDTADQ